MKIKDSLVSYNEWAKRQSWGTFHIGVIAPLCLLSYAIFPTLFGIADFSDNLSKNMLVVGTALLLNAIFCLRVVTQRKAALILGFIGACCAVTGILHKLIV